MGRSSLSSPCPIYKMCSLAKSRLARLQTFLHCYLSFNCGRNSNWCLMLRASSQVIPSGSNHRSTQTDDNHCPINLSSSNQQKSLGSLNDNEIISLLLEKLSHTGTPTSTRNLQTINKSVVNSHVTGGLTTRKLTCHERLFNLITASATLCCFEHMYPFGLNNFIKAHCEDFRGKSFIQGFKGTTGIKFLRITDFSNVIKFLHVSLK